MQNELKHTPGPWQVTIWNGYSKTMAHIIFSKSFQKISTVNWWPEESETATHETGIANAKLIAAAPELLEIAIQAFVFLQKQGGYQSIPLINKIEEAINKATK